MKMRIPFAMTLGLLCTNCAALSSGFYVQRTQDTYDLQVGAVIGDAQNAFYRGAYEICKNSHNSGFEIKSKSWNVLNDNSGPLRGTFQCRGDMDVFLGKKYKTDPVQMIVEDSNRVFRDGKKYRFEKKK